MSTPSKPGGPIDIFQRQFPCSTWTTRFLVWGRFCQGGAPGGLSIFFNVSFLVRPGQPVSSPRPTRNEVAGARRSGQGWARSATRKGLVLDGFEHDGTLVVVGMTKFEGSPRVVHEHSCHILVCGGVKTQTMMQ